MKKTKFLFLLLGMAYLFAASCKKPKPGANQPPAAKEILYYTDWIVNNKINSSTKTGLRVVIQSKVENASGQIVTYNTQVKTGPYVFNGQTATLNLPTQVSGYVVLLNAEYLDCTWPVPGMAANPSIGGKAVHEASTPIYTAPQSIVINNGMWSLVYSYAC